MDDFESLSHSRWGSLWYSYRELWRGMAWHGMAWQKKCKIIRQVEKVERPYLTDAMALIRPRLSGCHRQNTYCTRCGCCQGYTQRGDACLFPTCNGATK